VWQEYVSSTQNRKEVLKNLKNSEANNLLMTGKARKGLPDSKRKLSHFDGD